MDIGYSILRCVLSHLLWWKIQQKVWIGNGFAACVLCKRKENIFSIISNFLDKEQLHIKDISMGHIAFALQFLQETLLCSIKCTEISSQATRTYLDQIILPLYISLFLPWKILPQVRENRAHVSFLWLLFDSLMFRSTLSFRETATRNDKLVGFLWPQQELQWQHLDLNSRVWKINRWHVSRALTWLHWLSKWSFGLEQRKQVLPDLHPVLAVVSECGECGEPWKGLLLQTQVNWYQWSCCLSVLPLSSVSVVMFCRTLVHSFPAAGRPHCRGKLE